MGQHPEKKNETGTIYKISKKCPELIIKSKKKHPELFINPARNTSGTIYKTTETGAPKIQESLALEGNAEGPAPASELPFT